MLNIVENDKTNIFIIGDIHGQFKAITPWIKNNKLENCIIIFCGDFGLGFDKLNKEITDLTKPNNICKERNIQCYAIRGNHDDPEYYVINQTRLNLSHFKTLSDYTIIKTPEHNILCLGGAVSTDRSYRLEAYHNELQYRMANVWHNRHEEIKCYWWKDEGFVYDEKKINEIIDSHIQIDTICSHAAPLNAYPVINNRAASWFARDSKLEEDITRERTNLDKLFSKLRETMTINNWFYGHYHEHHTDIIDGTKFTLLDMGRNGRFSTGPGGIFDMQQL